MRHVEVTASTLGRANPAAPDRAKPYRWRGNADWYPGNPAYAEEPAGHEISAITGKQRREARLAVFADALAEGLRNGLPESQAVREAGERCGVGADTARDYKRLLARRETQP